jgi:hypothetical protein
MALCKDVKYANYSSISIRAKYSNQTIWSVVHGEPMKIQVRLKQFETGFQIVFRLAGTKIELPFSPHMVLCRTKADCDPIIAEQSIMKLLRGEL